MWPEASSRRIYSFPEAKVNTGRTNVITDPALSSENSIKVIPYSASRIQGQVWSDQEILIFSITLMVVLALICGAGLRLKEEL